MGVSMTDGHDSNREGDGEIIFRSCITLRNGKKLYAASVGLKAFPIRVRKK